jgi:hypothetical protein
MWAVDLPVRQLDDFPGLGVEPISVAEFAPQHRADPQSVRGVDREVTPVEHCVHVGPQQQAVVQSVLASVGDWANMRRLQHRPDFVSRDGAVPMVGLKHHGLEGLLTEPVRREPRVAEHRPGLVPGLAEVEFDRRAKHELHEVPEVARNACVGHVVGLPLDDVRGEARGRVVGEIIGKKRHVANEHAADLRVLAGCYRLSPVMGDARAHLIQIGHAIRQAEHLPRLRDA